MEYKPVHALTSFVTPERDLFRVTHLGVPDVELDAWSFSIAGLVQHPLSLNLTDLASRANAEVMAFHECAGSPIEPLIPQRRIGNVVWGGVRLADLLEEAGVHRQARYVISRGADKGVWQGVHHPAYEKDLPIAKALDRNVLLALTVNGEPLPRDRGGPLRLVVPGYYGTNATKWLSSIELSAERSKSAFTTTYYTDREMVDGDLRQSPVWAVAPNAVIVAPANGQALAREKTEIRGWCWADRPIVLLEISVDGGDTWEPAELERPQDASWQAFMSHWTPRVPGEYAIMARATDETGATQKDQPRRNRLHRVMVHVHTSG